LLSTTERSAERGQVLVLFAGGLVALFLIAAIAFDVGSMLLERRTQQDLADASALAGARYVGTAANFNNTCANPGTNEAAQAACRIAAANDPNLAPSAVQINIPPVAGQWRGFTQFIQVRVTTSKSSIFGGIIGKATWPVGVNAVAANQPGVTYPFGMLALNPTACKAILISGTGTVNSNANVQSNSDGTEAGCGGIGLSRTGGGTLTVTADAATCRSVGSIQDQGSGTMTCSKDAPSFPLPDPLRNLAAPAKPALAAAMKEVVGSTLVATPSNVPDNCPGATGANAPSEATPVTCVLGQGGSQANRTWVLYPGLYPAGITAKGGVTVYLTPGIYWIGGGGLATSNDASLISITSETDRTAATCSSAFPPPIPSCDTKGGGILIYNSSLPTSPAGPITLGGGGATLNLQPYDYPLGTSTIPLVLFQDRTVALAGDDITLNGSSSQAASVRGIIYAAQGDVKVNGSASAFSMDQVIASTFKINGSGGTVNVLREAGVDAIIQAVGLVE
jgi:Flp pilus assembly protein TadG